MYRTNDAALAGAVTEHKSSGDTAGMIEALRALWTAQPEPQAPFDDPLEAEAWQAVVDTGAVSDAVAMGVELVRGTTLLRPRGFLHVVQNVRAVRGEPAQLDADLEQPAELSDSDAKLLLEIADLVRDAGWPADPYLGMVFFKLVEGRAKRLLWPYLKEQLDRFRRADETWQLVAALAASTSLTLELDDWLADLPERRGIASWMIGLYLRYAQREPLSADELQALFEACADGDEGQEIVTDLQLETALRGRDWPGFLALADAHPDRLRRADIAGEVITHPLIAYVNRFKDGHRVTAADFEFTAPTGLMDSAREGIRINQGLVDLCRELGITRADHAEVFRLFRELLTTDRGDGGRILELWRQFRAFKKPESLAWAAATWECAVRERSRWTTRLRYAIFG